MGNDFVAAKLTGIPHQSVSSVTRLREEHSVSCFVPDAFSFLGAASRCFFSFGLGHLEAVVSMQVLTYLIAALEHTPVG